MSEILWGQVFDFATRDSEWFTSTKLNPGRWALGFPAMYALFRILDEVRPQRILEFGLGESTRLTSQYCTHFSGAELTVIEQSEEWKEAFCRNYPHLKENIKVVPLRISGRGVKRQIDHEGLLSVVEGVYDLIIVDGPWGSLRDSRRDVLDIVEAGLLADDFVILCDDTDRPGEKDTQRKLRAMLKARGIKFYVGRYCGEFETDVICSEKYRFMCSM